MFSSRVAAFQGEAIFILVTEKDVFWNQAINHRLRIKLQPSLRQNIELTL
jgi:hypothetical protein